MTIVINNFCGKASSLTTCFAVGSVFFFVLSISALECEKNAVSEDEKNAESINKIIKIKM
jgi:hypothetical protein